MKASLPSRRKRIEAQSIRVVIFSTMKILSMPNFFKLWVCLFAGASLTLLSLSCSNAVEGPPPPPEAAPAVPLDVRLLEPGMRVIISRAGTLLAAAQLRQVKSGPAGQAAPVLAVGEDWSKGTLLAKGKDVLKPLDFKLPDSSVGA